MLRFWRVLVGLVVLLVGGVVAAAPAQAACTTKVVGIDARGKLIYKTVCEGEPGTPGGGEGGGTVPSCTLTGLQDYCIGSVGCWSNIPAAVPPTPAEEAAKPSPEAVWVYQRCDEDDTNPLSGYTWREVTGPTLDEAAQQAFGALVVPAFQIGVNPPRQAVVGIPTWYWVDPAGAPDITGSAALGVVAIGTPSGIELDPGDGSGTRTCPWTVTASGTCAHTYNRSSAGRPADADGRPAYTARARLLYDVRFEVNGAPLVIPGTPDSLQSPWATVSIPVAEVQSVVTRTP
ncbi:hypothetical protein [Cellulomonas fengjieae]|uniref:hypothetical protein n=1 Tax=Cellulomonas fengjieae TaxID=2819978 RepID=UPI001AAF1195|nr:hypothetical protein [Cellulomonas fengjieae]MBO3102635.1 hypothetical protein [Cellulomonas fengjieae]